MGTNDNSKNHSRRQFLSLFKGTDQKEEVVKMLTPDGKLVTVPKSAIQKSSNRSKAENQDIYNWMKNPSKAEEGGL